MSAWGDIRRYLGFAQNLISVEPGVGFRVGRVASLPTCAERLDGVVHRIPGTGGVLAVCRKDSTGYAWSSLATPTFVHFCSRDAATDVVADYRWDNMPLAQTELFGLAANRRLIDLSGMQQLNFAVEMSGSGSIDPGSIIDLQYSTNIGTPSWTDLNLDLVLALSSWTESGWTDIPSAARTKALWRVVGEGGDGVDDPVFVSIQLQAR